MWIKVCGMNGPEGVAAALEAGADAIGFVFAESVRRVTPEDAARLAQPARGRVKLVAVTLHPSLDLWREIARTFQPDLLQTDNTDLDELAPALACEVLPVYRTGEPGPAKVPARILFEGGRSGTGTVADWSLARAWSQRTQVVLAGGLHAGNVAQAIAAVRPFGVDASSGVESAPGVKSPQKIFDYVRAARAAFGESST